MQLSHLTINYLSEPDWKEASEETYANFGSVMVWRGAISSFVPYLNDLQALLHPQEIEKAMRYRQENDRRQRIISKAVLRILVGRFIKVDPKEIRFKSDKNKKPYLESTISGNLHFNVSHSGNWILIALAANPVGVDVEQMDASFTYQNMLSFSFNKEEISYIKSAKIPYQNFYKLWTRKESLLKATGKGLVDDLTLIPSLDGVHQDPTQITGSAENWQISSFNVDENHVGSVSFMQIKTALQLLNFRL